MNKNPRVSVLMPVYNGERYLREAVESILDQTFTDFEFVIVDDGSTDNTWQILQSYAANEPRIVLVRNETNVGVARSLNKGLELARGEYVARMDADDVSLPGRLTAQVAFLDEHPEVGVLGCAVQVIDGCGNPSRIRRFPAEHGVIKWCLCFDDPIAHPTVMMRREVVGRVGGYSTDLLTAEDYDLWRRLNQVTRLSNLPEMLLYLRRHEACVTRAHRAKQLENSIKISHLRMSEALKEDVPVQVVQRLWSKEFEGLDHVRQAANLVYRLCQASIADSTLSPAEKRMIRRDAARRLFGLACQQTHDGRAWEVLGLACRLAPLIIGRAVAGRLRRIVHERLL